MCADLTKARPHVLVIDDSLEMLEMLAMLLEQVYQVSIAENGELGMKLALDLQPDLILLDVSMPGASGYAICQQFKRNSAVRHIPIVLMSGYIDAEGEARAFDVGAADCIRKPFELKVVWSRIRSLLARKAEDDRMRDQEAKLEEKVRRSADYIVLVEHVALQTLVNVVCTRDIETGAHIVRTQGYVRMLAEHLSHDERYHEELTPSAIDLMARSAPLHDIGKVGIPDSILRKPGPLTPEELQVMRTHPLLGLRALLAAERGHDSLPDLLRYAKDIAVAHHEKWDGSGYPYGLVGDKIPLAARLMAVSDVYDALISVRPYKKAMSHEAATKIMLQGSGSHFDPDVVQAFVALGDKFSAFSEEHRDREVVREGQ